MFCLRPIVFNQAFGVVKRINFSSLSIIFKFLNTLFIVEKASKCPSVYGSKSSKEEENLNEKRVSLRFPATVLARMYIHSPSLLLVTKFKSKTTKYLL